MILIEYHLGQGNKIPGSNKYHNNDKLPDTTDPTAQKEHNKYPKEDTDERGDSCGDETSDNKWYPPLPTYSPYTQGHHGTPPPQTLPRPA